MKTQNETQWRVMGERGNWRILATDNTGTWIAAEPGKTYRTKAEAVEAMQTWAANEREEAHRRSVEEAAL